VSHTEAQVEEILDFVGLLRLKGQAAATLPIGLLRRLEIARALALNPAILLLDEPAAGLNEQELKDLQVLICRIREQNVTSMLVEHTMRFVMALCKQVVVMDHGKKIAEGTPREVTMDKRVIEVYLGSSEEVNAT
jgi:branched-chain amino acid transport system ATP-binding protein